MGRLAAWRFAVPMHGLAARTGSDSPKPVAEHLPFDSDRLLDSDLAAHHQCTTVTSSTSGRQPRQGILLAYRPAKTMSCREARGARTVHGSARP